MEIGRVQGWFLRPYESIHWCPRGGGGNEFDQVTSLETMGVGGLLLDISDCLARGDWYFVH